MIRWSLGLAALLAVSTSAHADFASCKQGLKAEAVEKGAITFPPFETDTWPASRPLTEWLLRFLPEGGTGYVRPNWTKAAKKLSLIHI